MTNCKYITRNGRCGLKGCYAYRHGCFGENMCRCRVPMTNADRIRAMSDEELAEFLYQVGYENGWGMKESALEWLQKPAEEDKNGV